MLGAQRGLPALTQARDVTAIVSGVLRSCLHHWHAKSVIAPPDTHPSAGDQKPAAGTPRDSVIVCRQVPSGRQSESVTPLLPTVTFASVMLMIVSGGPLLLSWSIWQNLGATSYSTSGVAPMSAKTSQDAPVWYSVHSKGLRASQRKPLFATPYRSDCCATALKPSVPSASPASARQVGSGVSI